MGLMWKGENETNPYDLVDGTTALGCIHIGRDTHYNRIKETYFQGESWNFRAMRVSRLHSGYLYDKGNYRLKLNKQNFSLSLVK